MADIRMPDVNTVIIAGNLTRDPTFRKTTNGTPVANFWIASSRKFRDNTGQWRENVCYVGVVAWYRLAETCAENLYKGAAVLVEGELQSRSLRSEDGRSRNIVEIKAGRVQFLNRREDAVLEETPHPSAEATEVPQAESREPKPEPASEEAESNNVMKGKFDFGYQDLQL
ncbi:MAG TPA: single-stranded DNA-binding protein [bacterium]